MSFWRKGSGRHNIKLDSYFPSSTRLLNYHNSPRIETVVADKVIFGSFRSMRSTIDQNISLCSRLIAQLINKFIQKRFFLGRRDTCIFKEKANGRRRIAYRL